MTQHEQKDASMYGATITVGTEDTNAIPVTVQLGSRITRGAKLRYRVSSPLAIGMYVSSDAAGAVPVDLGDDDVLPSTGTAGEMLTGLDASTEKLSEFRVLTDDTGKVDVVLTNSSDETKTRYLNVILPDSRVVTSAAVTFADDTP